MFSKYSLVYGFTDRVRLFCDRSKTHRSTVTFSFFWFLVPMPARLPATRRQSGEFPDRLPKYFVELGQGQTWPDHIGNGLILKRFVQIEVPPINLGYGSLATNSKKLENLGTADPFWVFFPHVGVGGLTWEEILTIPFWPNFPIE